MNSHPGLFSRVRQSKHFLMSRPCVSCPNNRIFFLTNYKLFLVVVFFFSHFQASSTRVQIFLKKEIFLSIVEKKASTRSVFELVFARPHEDATKNGITIASLTGHALYDV